MKLILLADVPPLGTQGDLVEVAEGYARNFLLPRKKAMRASTGALAQAEKLRTNRVETEKKSRDDALKLATQLAGIRVVLAAHTGDEGRLYGSIGPADIVEGIRKFTGLDVERRSIELRAPIKAIGLHEVLIKVHPEVEFPITLDVIPG